MRDTVGRGSALTGREVKLSVDRPVALTHLEAGVVVAERDGHV